jgi:hypothetical protein
MKKEKGNFGYGKNPKRLVRQKISVARELISLKL